MSELRTDCLHERINTLLGTNEVPSLEVERSLLNVLVGPEKTLLEMRAEITRTQKKLESLVHNEKVLAQEIAPYQALVSPFRRLPDDILREMCLACLPDEYIPVIDIRQPPLLLTRISNRLRRVALSTPRLWTAINIPIVLPSFTEWHDGRNESRASVSERTMLKYTMIVNQWLGCTGACDVEIFVHEFGNDSADRYIDGIFNVIIARAAQWKSVSLHCSAYSIQRFCAMLGQSYSQFDFPRLERLSLDISGSYLEQDNPQEEYNYASQLPHALRLRSVRLVMPMDNYERYRFQWSCLAYLSLGSTTYPLSLNSIVIILESCTNIVNCRLYIKLDGTNLRLYLPHLKGISLVFDQEAWFNNVHRNFENAFSLCNQLDTPLLERVTFDATVDFLPLLGLVHRMGDHITHLSVTNFEVPTELIECLKACPLLVALNVSRPDGIPDFNRRHYQWLRPAPWASSLVSWTTAGDQLLRYLMTAGDVDEMIQAQLCPHLEHLAYHISDGPMSCEAIEAFILDKCTTQERGGARLKGLSVSVRGRQQDLERLQYSVEAQLLAGLRLRLSPGRIARYKLMEHGMGLEMTQPRWWEDERD